MNILHRDSREERLARQVPERVFVGDFHKELVLEATPYEALSPTQPRHPQVLTMAW